MKKLILSGLVLSVFVFHPFVAQAEETVTVKKSKSGICHNQKSAHFERTKNYTAFASMEECIKSGGRAPHKKTSSAKK